MAIRDLGYRAYEGARRPPSQNTRVLFRYGLRRAWASWLVKIATFTAWIPPVIMVAVVALFFWIGRQVQPGAVVDTSQVPPSKFVRDLLFWQTWIFGTLVSVGAGAVTIAEELAFKAFPFYFSKPVTPAQFLLGRTSAVGLWIFLLTFLPALALIVALTGTLPETIRMKQLGAVGPAFLYCLLLASVMSCASIGASSWSTSRALTRTAWVALLFVPHVAAAVVDVIADWPWLYLGSILALVGVVGDALFDFEPHATIQWYHALPVLGLLTGGAIWTAYSRVRQAEVIK